MGLEVNRLRPPPKRMRKPRLQIAVGWLLVILGFVHSLLTVQYGGVTPGALWFFGSGVLVILVGWMNVLFARSARGDSIERNAWMLVVFANVAGVLLAAAFVWMTRGREGQGFLLLLLFLVGAGLTLRRPPASKGTGGTAELFGLGAVLPVPDVAASVAYYRDVLGFSVDFVMGEPADHGSVTRNRVGIQFTLVDRRDAGMRYAGWTYVFVNDIDRLHAEYMSNAVTITQALGTRDHGMREFEIADNNGHRLRFGQYTE